MKTLKSFLVEKGITEETFKGYSADEQASLYNEMNEANSASFKALSESVEATKEQIEAAKDSLRSIQVEQLKALNEALKEQGLAIKALTEKEKVVRQSSIKEALIANKENLKMLKDGKSGEFSMTIKAAGTMLGSTNVSGGNVPVEQRLSGLNTIASRRVRLMDIVSSGTATSNLISWAYQANKDGAAGGTAEGALKNQIDFDIVVASQAVVKRTAFIKISTEMLDDIDFIESEINNELMRELMKNVELTAYSGNGTAPNMNGVFTTATAFSPSSFATGQPNAVENPNLADVLVVAANQIALANQDDPNYILLNPSEVARLQTIKTSATDRRYIDRLQFVAGSMTLDGIPIVKTTLVTAGTYLIGDFSKATLFTKDSVRIEMGLDGNDYTNNLRTVLAEYRGAMVVKNNDRTAFVKGTFATDIAAITKA